MPEQIKQPAKVRIFNDGKPGYMTTVTNADTGENIPYVSYVCVLEPSSFPQATIKVFSPIIDIIVDAEIEHICPCCGTSI